MKAHLVAQGNNQSKGVNYTYTYNPVVIPTTMRCVIGIAITQDWQLQLDIRNVLLNDDINETIYMKQPLRIKDKGYSNRVCALKKALYMLRQAPWSWYSKLAQFLLSLGFHNSLSDASFLLLIKIPRLYGYSSM